MDGAVIHKVYGTDIPNSEAAEFRANFGKNTELKEDCVRFVATILYTYGIDLDRSEAMAEIPGNKGKRVNAQKADKLSRLIKKKFDECYDTINTPSK